MHFYKTTKKTLFSQFINPNKNIWKNTTGNCGSKYKTTIKIDKIKKNNSLMILNQ